VTQGSLVLSERRQNGTQAEMGGGTEHDATAPTACRVLCLIGSAHEKWLRQKAPRTTAAASASTAFMIDTCACSFSAILLTSLQSDITI
jgi:hypothetical protein